MHEWTQVVVACFVALFLFDNDKQVGDRLRLHTTHSGSLFSESNKLSIKCVTPETLRNR